MAMVTRAEKQAEIEALKSRFADGEILVITRNEGLTVAQDSAVRREMRASGAHYKVSKNKLVKIALKGTRFEGVADMFTGPTAIASSKDPGVAKIAQKFAKEIEKFKIVGGAMGDKILSAKDVEALATLPSLDELRSKICGLLVAAPTKLAGVLQAPARNVVGVFKAYGEKQ